MDESTNYKNLNALLNSLNDEDKVIICYTGIVMKQYVREKLGEFYGEMIFYPFAKEYRETSFRLRNEYVKFVSILGEKLVSKGRNLKTYFKIPFRDVSAWWFSLIAEKNPMKSMSIVTFYQLVTVINAIEKNGCNSVFLMVDNPGLSLCLKKYSKDDHIAFYSKRFTLLKYEMLVAMGTTMSAIYGFVQILKRSIILRRRLRSFSCTRRLAITEPNYIFVTYFPQVDKEAIKKGMFINKYFGPLQSGLEQKYKEKIAWILLQEQTFEYNENSGISLTEKLNHAGYKLFFGEEFLSPMDFLMTILCHALLAIRFITIK